MKKSLLAAHDLRSLGTLCPPKAFLGSGLSGLSHAQCPLPSQIWDLQRAALVKRAVQAAQRESRQRKFLAEQVQLLCINCMVSVGYGSDLRKVEGTHHVNVNPNFS